MDTPQIFSSQRGLHLRTQPGLRGRGTYTPRDEVLTAPGSQAVFFGGGGTLPFSPLSVVQGAPPPHPHEAEELRPNPWLGCGVGEGRRRGRLLLARHKETSFSLGSMATLRGGSTHRILPTPPAGLGALAATHLRSAYLGWGRGDAAAGGLGAVSIFVSPAPGAQGSTTMGWDAKGAARGSVARVLELWGDPRGLLLVRGSSCYPRVPRFGDSVYQNWGESRTPDLGAS